MRRVPLPRAVAWPWLFPPVPQTTHSTHPRSSKPRNLKAETVRFLNRSGAMLEFWRHRRGPAPSLLRPTPSLGHGLPAAFADCTSLPGRRGRGGCGYPRERYGSFRLPAAIPNNAGWRRTAPWTPFCPALKDESVLPCVWLEMCLPYPGCITEWLLSNSAGTQGVLSFYFTSPGSTLCRHLIFPDIP